MQVRSRFAGGGGGAEDLAPFLACLDQLGFDLVKQDARNKMFVELRLRRRRDAGAPPSSIPWPRLKVCQYKRR